MFLFSFLFYCFNTAEDERKINQNHSFTLVVDDVFKNLEVAILPCKSILLFRIEEYALAFLKFAQLEEKY